MTQVLTPEDAAVQAANRIKHLQDIRLPRLPSWNYSGVCSWHQREGHTEPVPSCPYQECGGDLYGYQRVGTAWLYLRKRGLLGDDPGAGKTLILLHLVCLLHTRGELDARAVIVTQTPTVTQWVREARRWAPGIAVQYVTGKLTPAQRVDRYLSSNWDLLIVGAHVALRDRNRLLRLGPFSLVVSDDVDPLLDTDNATHRAIVSLANRAERSVAVNATTLQTRLEQPYAASLSCGGQAVFGTPSQFERKYVKREKVKIYFKNKKGERESRTILQTTGYTNLIEFRSRFEPLYLRRRLEDLTGVDLPELMPPSTVWLEMTPAQQTRYDKLRRGVIELLRAEGRKIQTVKAMTAWGYGQRICAGFPALREPDGPDASPKLDWLFEHLAGLWADRKVVAFMINQGMVEAALERASKAGIGAEAIWGKQSAEQRDAAKLRFARDPGCRLMIGSTAIERGHNLQVANTLVGVDTQLNPARVRQLVGRIRRAGSAHQRVWVFNLMMASTQEEGYAEVLRQRAGLSDFVFDETVGAEIFGGLSAFELLELITR